jgi:hypothetical protein
MGALQLATTSAANAYQQTKLVVQQLHQQNRLTNEQKERVTSFQRGLIKMGALVPQQQALPITKDLFYEQVLPRVPMPLRPVIRLAWLTASRWDDVRHLRTTNLRRLTPNRLLVEFTKTKTTQGRPFRTDMAVVIEQPQQVIDMLWDYARQQQGALTTLTTQQVTRLLHEMKPPEQLVNDFPHCRKRWTAHSIKAGAITHLMKCAALQQVNIATIPILAKHKTATAVLPETTIRYSRNTGDLALALGTHELTRLL